MACFGRQGSTEDCTEDINELQKRVQGWSSTSLRVHLVLVALVLSVVVDGACRSSKKKVPDGAMSKGREKQA